MRIATEKSQVAAVVAIVQSPQYFALVRKAASRADRRRRMSRAAVADVRNTRHFSALRSIARRSSLPCVVLVTA
jgi:hypothetical protein